MTNRPNPDNVLFWLGRHGTTELNQEDRFRGPLNVNLDEQGRRDAQDLSDFFDRVKLGGIISSDKNRAIETALAVGHHRDLTPTVDPNLASWNVGYLAGQVKADHEDEIQHYAQNPDEPIPQGESLNQFRQRIRPMFAKAIQFKKSSKSPLLLLAHASVIREASNVFNGAPNLALVHPGGAMAIVHDEKGMRATPIFKPDPVDPDHYS